MPLAAVRRFASWFFLVGLACWLAACGGGAGGGSSTAVTPVTKDSLTLTMTLADGSVANRFPAGSAVSIGVQLLAASDPAKPIANARITFSSTATIATLGLPSGQTLTDGRGLAVTTLTGVAQGVDVLSVTASYTDSKGAAQTLSTTLTYEVLKSAVVVPTQPSLKIAFDGSNNVVSGSQSNLVATVLDVSGKPVPNALVTFSNDSSYAVFNPESGTTLTDASGIARMGIIGTSKLGADKISASVSVAGAAGVDTTATASIPYQVVASSPVGVPTLNLALSVGGSNSSTLQQNTDGLITAVFVDAKGLPIANALVTFELASSGAGGAVSLGALSALTDSQGRASTSVFGASVPSGTPTRGAVTINATASAGKQSAAATLSFNYVPLIASIKSLQVALPPGLNALPASSTASVVATLVDAASGSPLTDTVTVNFTSACAQSGRATISASAINIGGQATATYTDKGCGSQDTITATVGSRSLSTSLLIAAASASSLTFVDAVPTTLGIKGSGNGEVATVRFRLVDASGNPVAGGLINFSLSTAVGGVKLNTTSASSDSNGLVSALVQSGTVGAPLVVTATLASNAAIWAQSRQLYVSTKIPHQNGFSLSASAHNPEFFNYDGETITLTVHASDRFGLPVPDGTPINFRTEGGIGIVRDLGSTASPVGGCVTSGSACTVQLTSAGDRSRLQTNSGPFLFDTGRQVIIAFAVGEDSFDDNNGNGVFDAGDTFPPASNSGSYRQGEPYLDANANAVRDNGEEFVDYNNNGSYDGPDGKYRGISCAHPSLCASSPSRLVFDSNLIIWSGSAADFSRLTLAAPDADGDGNAATATGLGAGAAAVSFTGSAAHGGCTDGQVLRLSLPLTDGRSRQPNFLNPLPVGTTVAITTTNGTLDANSASYTVPDTTEAPIMPIVLSSDATYDATSATCTNSLSSGVLTIKITTPKGIVSQYSIGVRD
ncbi:hypothetical protein [Chitinimonas sp.]|uniref:hypothetical protein n=1 Tax=Chitinimonas sp. TaxID=1934313 RepID=UPI0035B0AA79